MDFSIFEKQLASVDKSRWDALLTRFQQLGSVIVAFSGGVDSGLLCAAAWRALGDRMLAVTIKSPVESMGDLASAQILASRVGFPLRVVEINDLSNPEFAANPPDRCYICKRTRFRLLYDLAIREGYTTLVEGSNADDLDDYRPGRRAVSEIGAVSPLQELGFTKNQIRSLAKAMDLSVWDRPSAPCLATRFPYGRQVTRIGLHQVAEGERYLHSLGFNTVRVRHHGDLARIEVEAEAIEQLASMRQKIAAQFKSIGFLYTAVDLTGYRQGSLNEVLQ